MTNPILDWMKKCLEQKDLKILVKDKDGNTWELKNSKLLSVTERDLAEGESPEASFTFSPPPVKPMVDNVVYHCPVCSKANTAEIGEPRPFSINCFYCSSAFDCLPYGYEEDKENG